jgi:hypothetical protein
VKSALHDSVVGLPWIMHVEADLLDGVGDVGAGERHVLEGLGEAPEVSQISNRRPGLSGSAIGGPLEKAPFFQRAPTGQCLVLSDNVWNLNLSF